jgi:large subunit ribosomal protein L3
MLNTILGKKIGMTQFFDQNGIVVPVTVVNVACWYVTQIKCVKRDGYSALQLGLLKQRYVEKNFSSQWLQKKNIYFSYLREVFVEEGKECEVGKKISFDDISLQEGEVVQVAGKSKGLGFQGVVKRWNFKGGPCTHGSTFHRVPGSIGHLTREGKVIKGKKLPGRCGNKKVTVKGLKIIKLDKDTGCIFIKGALPGKKNTIFSIKKQGV